MGDIYSIFPGKTIRRNNLKYQTHTHRLSKHHRFKALIKLLGPIEHGEYIKDRPRDLKGQFEGESYKKIIKTSADVEFIVKVVADKYNNSMEDIYVAKKKPLFSKKIALYLSKRLTALTDREIGEWFGTGHSAVSKAAILYD